MIRKIFGCILLLLGTCVGAGMLAIPLVSASEHFVLNAMLLILAWGVMTIGALAVLEVNLWFEPGSNLVSMAHHTLGKYGKLFTSLVYLLLMYSLVSAYLSAGSDVVRALFELANITISHRLASVITLVVLGSIVYIGIVAVDLANRTFMSLKLVLYAIIVAALMPHLHGFNLSMSGDWHIHNSSFVVMICAFGYATIIPTMREYLNSDTKALKTVIFAGSGLTLIIFFLWMLTVQGVIIRTGVHGLVAISQSKQSTSRLIAAIVKIFNNPGLHLATRVFISIQIITSFLGVSISLADFIADGVKKKKQGFARVWIHALCFLPPLGIILVYPGIFIKALAYGGNFCIVLLIIIPLVMLYRGRYQLNLEGPKVVPGKHLFLILSIALAVLFLILQFIH